MLIEKTLPQIFKSAFQNLVPLFSNDLDLLQSRREALSHFDKLGLPGNRLDDWKYTDLSSIPFHILQPSVTNKRPSLQEIEPLLIDKSSPYQWLFYNGHSFKEFSSNTFLIQKLSKIAPIPITTQTNNSFQVLNHAFYLDGAHLILPKNAIIQEPIIIVHVTESDSDPVMTHPRNIIIAEENSKASVIELYLNKGNKISFSNTLSHITLKKGAEIKHFFLQRGTRESLQITHLNIEQAQNSHYTGTFMTADGGINRASVNIELNEKNAECQFYALATLKDHQKTDVAFTVKHNKPSCKSQIITRSVVQAEARNSFTGKIVVQKNATKTEASLESKSLLLSEKAEVNTRPQLEIYNHDIQCSHGATVGFLDAEALFYLRSRGLCEKVAKQLLINGFIHPTLQAIPTNALKYVENLIHEY